MKRTFTLIIFSTLLYSINAASLELVVASKQYYGMEGRGSINTVNIWDTSTIAAAPGEMIPVYSRDALPAAALAPDRWLYYAECSERVPATCLEGNPCQLCVPKILRTAITINADGSVGHGPEQLVYRSPDPSSLEEHVNMWISDLAIRSTDDAGNYRVYFSTVGFDGRTIADDDTERNIYYLDDAGDPQLYYTVRFGDLPVSSCDGLVGFWAGNFDFDSNGELYLSSGHHIPAGLFHVPGASADTVTGSPIKIDERECGAISDFIIDEPDRIFFAPNQVTNVVYERNIDTDAESLSLELPLDFLDPPLGPSADINVLDISEVFPRHAAPIDPSIVRGPPIANRAKILPRSDAHTPRQPPSKLHGRLADWLPLPPRPDMNKPELRIIGIETGGPLIKAGRVTIPFRIFIRNDGIATAKPFNIAINANLPRVTIPVKTKITSPCAGIRRSPRINQIGTGQILATGGTLEFKHPQGISPRNQSIAITVEADSCSGDFFGFVRRKYCRIKESNEDNNTMTVQLKL